MTDEDTGSRRKESPPRGYQDSGGLVPVPDPTLLTTQNLLREVASLKELLDAQIAATNSLFDEKIARYVAVSNEKFEAVAAQFSERDTRTDQRAGDTKLAVDAAFAAAKEATAKIEAGFTKQIDAMIVLIDTKTANLEGNLADLKERMVAMESRSSTGHQMMVDQRGGNKQNLDVVAIAVSLIAVIVAVAIAVASHIGH
jgi:hypothetical protein